MKKCPVCGYVPRFEEPVPFVCNLCGYSESKKESKKERKPVTLKEIDFFRENFDGQLDTTQIQWLIDERVRLLRVLRDITNACQSEYQSTVRIVREKAQEALDD